MPLYNYLCKTHGEFNDWRAMSLSAEPTPCPVCAQDAPRAVSIPSLALMDSNSRRAHGINEHSAHEPRQVTAAEATATGQSKHTHDHGHNHAHGHSHAAGGSRPWMIGH